MELLLNEEHARIVGEEMGKSLKAPSSPVPSRSEAPVGATLGTASRMVDLKEKVVKYRQAIVSSKTRGRLKEMTLVSNNKSYTVHITIDGAVTMRRTFTELENLSEKLETIDAFQDTDGNYTLHIQDIHWLQDGSILISVDTEDGVTFSNIFASWSEDVFAPLSR